jgi:hypothetical protein
LAHGDEKAEAKYNPAGGFLDFHSVGSETTIQQARL